MSLSVLLLRESFGWMGSHSGYDQICEAFTLLQPETHNVNSVWKDTSKSLSRVSRRILSRLSRRCRVSPFYDLHSTAAELSTLWNCFRHHPQIVHVSYLEHTLGILPNYTNSFSFKLIATAHQPASWWRLIHRNPKITASLDALIVPAKQEIAYFEQFLPNRVFFVPHGVDLKFFHPKPDLPHFNPITNSSPRFVFSGFWLRDIQTMAQVIDRVLLKNPQIKFDMIVPLSKRDDPNFYRIARHDQVLWHSGISDEQLRSIYQQATALVLPLLDCTANNAVLEAMSCGLPIISNCVGGVRDYTDPKFANLLPVGDVDGLTEAILNIADAPTERVLRGKLARSHAEENYAWSSIAAKTLEIYTKVV